MLVGAGAVEHHHGGEGALPGGKGDDGGDGVGGDAVGLGDLNGDGFLGVGGGLYGGDDLIEVSDHLGQLRPGQISIGVQIAVLIAVHDAGIVAEFHPLRQIGAQVAQLRSLLGGGVHRDPLQLGIVSKDRSCIGAADLSHGREIVNALDIEEIDILIGRPTNGVAIPSIRVIQIDFIAIFRPAFHIVDDLVDLRPGDSAAGVEDVGGGTGGAHEAIVDDVVHGLGVPGILVYVSPLGGGTFRRRLRGRLRRQGGGRQTQGQGEGQQQGEQLSFHLLFSTFLSRPQTGHRGPKCNLIVTTLS